MKLQPTVDELLAMLALPALFIGITGAFNVFWALIVISLLVLVYAFLPDRRAE